MVFELLAVFPGHFVMFEKYSVSEELIKYFICVFLKKCQQIKIAIFS